MNLLSILLVLVCCCSVLLLCWFCCVCLFVLVMRCADFFKNRFTNNRRSSPPSSQAAIIHPSRTPPHHRSGHLHIRRHYLCIPRFHRLCHCVKIKSCRLYAPKKSARVNRAPRPTTTKTEKTEKTTQKIIATHRLRTPQLQPTALVYISLSPPPVKTTEKTRKKIHATSSFLRRNPTPPSARRSPPPAAPYLTSKLDYSRPHPPKRGVDRNLTPNNKNTKNITHVIITVFRILFISIIYCYFPIIKIA